MATIEMNSAPSISAKRNETDVDRELEKLAGLMLSGNATEGDKVKYRRLQAWRRRNLIQMPTRMKRFRLKKQSF